ncbi:unnamed protein product [Mucor hiemalis]
MVTKAISILKFVFAFIFVLFIDAVNRLQRIEDQVPEEKRQFHDYGHEASLKANKFYAQRNLYLTGFTLFLSLILERTSTLVIDMLKHEEQLEYAKEEHKTSTQNQERLVEIEKSYKEQIDALNNELKGLQQESKDIETLKKQVQQQSEEYHQLAVEKNLLATEPKKTI